MTHWNDDDEFTLWLSTRVHVVFGSVKIAIRMTGCWTVAGTAGCVLSWVTRTSIATVASLRRRRGRGWISNEPTNGSINPPLFPCDRSSCASDTYCSRLSAFTTSQWRHKRYDLNAFGVRCSTICIYRTLKSMNAHKHAKQHFQACEMCLCADGMSSCVLGE